MSKGQYFFFLISKLIDESAQDFYVNFQFLKLNEKFMFAAKTIHFLRSELGS